MSVAANLKSGVTKIKPPAQVAAQNGNDQIHPLLAYSIANSPTNAVA
jgi:hypothetical protein